MDCALALIQRGHAVGLVASALKLTRSNLFKAKKKSSNRTKTTRQCSRSYEDARLLSEIRSFLKRFPSFGYRRLQALINRDRRKRGESPVNHKRVYRVLKNSGLLLRDKPELPGRRRPHNGKVSVPVSDTRWCSDGLEFKCLNGESISMTFVLDCCDREIISFVAKTGRGLPGWMVREAMILAVEKRFGDYVHHPRVQFLSDNGSAYRAVKTENLMMKLNLQRCRTAVCSPESNGMAESMVRTLKRDYLPFIDLSTAEVALKQLMGIVRLYNEEHPHSALGYQSPKEFRAKHCKSEIEPLYNENIVINLGRTATSLIHPMAR